MPSAQTHRGRSALTRHARVDIEQYDPLNFAHTELSTGTRAVFHFRRWLSRTCYLWSCRVGERQPASIAASTKECAWGSV